MTLAGNSSIGTLTFLPAPSRPSALAAAAEGGTPECVRLGRSNAVCHGPFSISKEASRTTALRAFGVALAGWLIAGIPSFAADGATGNIHLRINCGGPDIENRNSSQFWESDRKYSRGGNSFPFKTEHDVSDVHASAPQEVYQTVRHLEHRYDFPELPNGAYTIRFHFTDGFPSDHRKMDYTVEGKKVIDDLNIYRRAGGINKALIIEAKVEVSDGNGLQIVGIKDGKASDAGNDVFEAGLEIIGKDEIERSVEPPQFGGKVPEALDWLRSRCGDGALAYHAEGKIYIVELSTGKTEVVGNGWNWAFEWSPDASQLAWIDDDDIKVRRRHGDRSVRTIERGAERQAGIHWLNDEILLAVVRRGNNSSWHQISLNGEMKPVPQLNRLGLGGKETDVKRCDDGVWSYVADRHWRTSDGENGHIGGGCSCSLSPDGRAITALQGNHRECKLNSIRSSGEGGLVRWRYEGSFDNHGWASHDPRFIVCLEEREQIMVVIEHETGYATRMGKRHRNSDDMYGDFVTGSGKK